MGGMDSKIAKFRARIRGTGVAHALLAALVSVGSSALAQEYRGSEQQRIACTPDVFRLCSWEIPNVDRIIACLRREKPRLSVGCREVFEMEPASSRAATNNGVAPHHFPQRHLARHHLPREYEKSDARE